MATSFARGDDDYGGNAGLRSPALWYAFSLEVPAVITLCGGHSTGAGAAGDVLEVDVGCVEHRVEGVPSGEEHRGESSALDEAELERDRSRNAVPQLPPNILEMTQLG